MLEYLEKFNNLPSEVKEKISAPAVMAALEELEGEYGVELAGFVMRIMVGDLYFKNLTANLIIEFNLEPESAGRLARDLQQRIFDQVMDYLNSPKPLVTAKPELSSPFFGNKTAPAAAPGPIVRRAPVSQAAPINFLEEDKADIAAAVKIATGLRTVPQEKSAALLAAIISEAKIGFASTNLLSRFQETLLSYLRGVRTKVEVKENLMKDFPSGGVRMSESEADRILNIAQRKLTADEEKFAAGSGKVTAKSTANGTNFIFNQAEIKQAIAQRNESPKNQPPPAGKPSGLGVPGARDVDYDLSALKNNSTKNAGTQNLALKSVGPQNLAGESAGEQNIASPQKTENAGTQNIALQPNVEKTGTQGIAFPRNDETKRTAAVMGNKKRMEDIKPSPRTMSPIDELAYMDLVNFRRLDPSPAARITKIEAKIALLEKEGIDKKIEGIRVWRLNPVNKTYLSMGQESIAGGKSIDDIIKERKEQGLNYLSQEEFEAVMDLNNNLRF